MPKVKKHVLTVFNWVISYGFEPNTTFSHFCHFCHFHHFLTFLTPFLISGPSFLMFFDRFSHDRDLNGSAQTPVLSMMV